MDIDKLAQRFTGRYAQTTEKIYSYHLKQYFEWCEKNSIDVMDARKGDIEQFIVELNQLGLATASVGLRFTAVSSFYRYLHDDERIDRNPCVKVRAPRVDPDSQRRTVLSPLEYAAYLTASRKLGVIEHAVAVLGGMMGLRSGEMTQLKVADVKMVKGYYTVKYVAKGGKVTISPIPYPALRAILDAVDAATSEYLLTSKAGYPLNTRSLCRVVARTTKAAGIEHDLTPHGLRRTFATAGFMRQVSLRDMQVAMRHMRAETTMLYDRDQESFDRHASHLISSFLSSFTS